MKAHSLLQRRALGRIAALVTGGIVVGAPLLTACGPAPSNAAHVAGAAVQPAKALGETAAAAAPANVAGAGSQLAHAAELPPVGTALDDARARLLDGDYQGATRAFQALPSDYPGTPEAAEAVLRLGEAQLADGKSTAAAASLRSFVATNPAHPLRGTALLLLGRALEGQGDGGAAAAAYGQYEQLAAQGQAAPLDDYLHLLAANIYFGAGRVSDGWAELTQAVSAADQAGSASAKVRAYDALGARYTEAGNRLQAAAAWRTELEAMVAAHRTARDTAAVAQRLVSTYVALGQRDAANALRWRIVGEWPGSAAAWQAMNDLGASTVPAYLRGVIAFSNRRWAAAEDAFTWYVDNGSPDGHDDEAHFDLAVALARQNDDAALGALDSVARTYPASDYAPEALWEAANLLLRQNDRPAAAARYERLAVGFPASDRRGEALYWLGKLLPDLGNAAAGQRYMEAAAVSGYEDYYTFRARAALKRPALAPKTLQDQETITADERAAWEQWLSDHGRATASQAELRSKVEQDLRFLRGTALLDAGFNTAAEQEFRELVDNYQNDPVALEFVAVHVRDRGMYPLSVTLGHRLLDSLVPLGETSLLAAPRVVQKLVLPLAFIRLVAPAAEANHLDPLLLLGLMKQESWFEPRAASSASARGLTQFIYETAKTVADEMQWPDWTWDDMNKPYVSVPFGAHYLSGLIRDFRGNYYFALAGYNGGPGNVLRWARGDWNRDVDSFVEGIGYSETRSYVKAVTGNFELYKAIYYK